jgi:SAM-dependent methyltransferase
VYLKLPGKREAGVVASVAAPGAEVLELGCGPGRVTRALVALGFRVTGVDNSEAMLAHVTFTHTVLADIEALQLDQQFDVVMLASNFVNAPDQGQRVALLRTCARHVRDSGLVLVERYAPGWVNEAAPSRRERLGVVFDLHDVEHNGEVLHATMTYEVDGESFDQRFTAVDVDDERLSIDAATAGLVMERLLDDDATWVVLRPRLEP